jgi:hypothetical protein
VRIEDGTPVVTERCVDRPAKSAPGEPTEPDSSPGSVTAGAPCSMDGDGWRVPIDSGAGSESGPTDRSPSGPVIAPRSHDRPQDKRTSDLETEGVSHKGLEYRPKTGAVSHDSANDQLITPVASRRVETRAQRRQWNSAADGRGATLTGRRAANAPRLPDIDLGADWTRDAIIQQQAGDAAISEVRRVLAAGGAPSDTTDSGDLDLQCYLKQWDSLTVIDGVVYRKFVDATGHIWTGTVRHFQLLLPLSTQAAFLSMIHATALCHARALNKNEAQVQLHAYWPTWKRDVRIFLAACRRCAEFHTGKLPR